MSNKARKKNAKPVIVNRNGKSQQLPESLVLEQLKQLSARNPFMALTESNRIQTNNPHAEQIRAFYYQTLSDMEMKQELLLATEQKLAKSPRDKLALSYRAHVLRLSGNIEAACALLEKVVKITPNDAQAVNSLATAVKEMGDFERADQLLHRAIALKPGYGKAYWNNSDISSSPEKDLADITDLLNRKNIADEDLHYLHFSAYRMLEKKGEFANAFHHLQAGNQLKLKQLNYSVEQDLKIDKAIRQLFTEQFIGSQKVSGQPLKSPIFIFGMPRSGTTLVEQILASHSQVQGGNELSALGDATREIQRRYQLKGEFPTWLGTLPDTGWAEIGESYKKLTRPIIQEKPYLTDKALLNYKTVGLIRLSLPNAKLIQVDRNPMDVCFGCYRQLFSNGLKFSYSFEDLAKTYLGYQQLMDHWHQVLPGFVYKIKYEDLVNSPQSQIQSILEFCNLEPEAACFESHKTKRTVRTLSATQVREPIFKHGVNRWLSYETQLEPLKELLNTQDP